MTATGNPPDRSVSLPLQICPAWIRFIVYCKTLGHGEIEKLKIADGVPVLAEKVTEKTKFT